MGKVSFPTLVIRLFIHGDTKSQGYWILSYFFSQFQFHDNAVFYSYDGNILYTFCAPHSIRFLSRVSTLMHDINIAHMSVCLSIRDVTVLDENGSPYCHSFFTIQ